MKITFFVNQYDYEGDLFDKGIFLDFDNKFMLKLNNRKELDEMIADLEKVKKQISENYLVD